MILLPICNNDIAEKEGNDRNIAFCNHIMFLSNSISYLGGSIFCFYVFLCFVFMTAIIQKEAAVTWPISKECINVANYKNMINKFKTCNKNIS